MSNNRYYDRWKRLYEGYQHWKKYLAKSGMPASAAELNAKKEGLKAAGVVSGRGTAAVEPFIETIAVALKEMGSTFDLQCGTATLTLSAACGPAPVRSEEGRIGKEW